jgi:hypothetical protein
MKKIITLLSATTILGLFAANNMNAATQVYDLKADWSDTQNPNGTWSYRWGGSLLVNNPFPWVGAGYSGCQPHTCAGFLSVPTIEKVSGSVKSYAPLLSIYPGVIEDGDVLVLPGLLPGTGGNILWTAPESGTIDISGSLWSADESGTLCEFNLDGPMTLVPASWTLTRNGGALSDGTIRSTICLISDPRSSPDDFSLGSGGAAALQNIPVAAGDQVVLAFGGAGSVQGVGINFSITLTPDSVDPVSAVEDLAETVAAMNLQNGIENSLDAKLDAALNVLTDVNVNNDGAACNSLQAFISAVQAQRGKKITNAQADQLIASAQQIKAMLNCAN